MKNKLLFMTMTFFIGLIMTIAFAPSVNAAENTTQEFIDEIKDYSMELAYDNDLYASVMIAQAILESESGQSGLAARDHNLFGVKGAYKGKSAKYWTYEDDGTGNYIKIQANFKKYPSFKESLEDYVILLRNGIGDGFEDFYSGTWKSETESWEEAAFFLQGRYATDTRYFSKLSTIIEKYNLTQYDVSIEEYYKKPANELIDTIHNSPYLNCVQSSNNMFNVNKDGTGLILNTRNLISLDSLFAR